MIVRFGLELDRLLPTKPETSLGYVTTGPGAFLSILETQQQAGVSKLGSDQGKLLISLMLAYKIHRFSALERQFYYRKDAFKTETKWGQGLFSDKRLGMLSQD